MGVWWPFCHRAGAAATLSIPGSWVQLKALEGRGSPGHTSPKCCLPPTAVNSTVHQSLLFIFLKLQEFGGSSRLTQVAMDLGTEGQPQAVSTARSSQWGSCLG